MSDLPDPLLSFTMPDAALQAVLIRADVEVTRYREAQIKKEILPNSLEAIRVEMTYHSNAIEGSTLSLRETQLVLEGLAPAAGKALRELYEARNHDRALRLIEHWARLGPRAITEVQLREVHRIIMTEIDTAGAGQYRTGRVLITGTRFVPPGPHKFAEVLPRLLEQSQGSSHVILRAAELHYNLVAVHPFADGNGRTARLMMNLLLLQNGFPLTIVPVERRPAYIAALESANSGDGTPLIHFVAECVIESVQRLLGEGSDLVD
jgi:Fic family protein